VNISFARAAHDWRVDFLTCSSIFPKDGCSTLDLSIVSLFIMMAFLSLGRIFGGLRFL
jgi:hypothetical protein